MDKRAAMKRPAGFANCTYVHCAYLCMFVYMNICNQLELVSSSPRRSSRLCTRAVQVLHVCNVCSQIVLALIYVCACFVVVSVIHVCSRIKEGHCKDTYIFKARRRCIRIASICLMCVYMYMCLLARMFTEQSKLQDASRIVNVSALIELCVCICMYLCVVACI